MRKGGGRWGRYEVESKVGGLIGEWMGVDVGEGGMEWRKGE